jgi:hypothetical protein
MFDHSWYGMRPHRGEMGGVFIPGEGFRAAPLPPWVPPAPAQPLAPPVPAYRSHALRLVHPSGIEGLIFGSWGYAIRREASLRRSSGRAWPWWR